MSVETGRAWWSGATSIGGIIAMVVLAVDVALLAVGREDVATGAMIAGLAVARLV